MKIKNKIVIFFTGALVGIGLYSGIVTTLAVWPTPPEGENHGGWLSLIFDLNQSSSGKLIVQSEKMGIGAVNPQAKLEVDGKLLV